MDHLLRLDMSALFTPTLSMVEVLLRGALMYLGLCLLLRVVPKRQVGKWSPSDLLFLILLGKFCAEGISRNATSITDYLGLMLIVVFLTYVVDRLGYHLPWFRRLMLKSPTCLIRDGRLLQANLAREMMTEDDLLRELRRQSVNSPACVLEAHLEANGEISVVKMPPDASASEPPAKQPNKDGENDPELRAFLLAAGKLQARLLWHQDQVARFKQALAQHGVRLKPSVSTTSRTDHSASPSHNSE